MRMHRISASETLKWLYSHPDAPLAVDTETRSAKGYCGTGLRVDDGRGICIGVSYTYRDGEDLYSSYIPINHLTGQNCDLSTWKRLKYVLRQGRPLIFANCQFDFLSLETVKIRVSEMPFYDVPTMANIARPYFPMAKSLDQLAKAYLPAEIAGKEVEWEWARYEEKTRRRKQPDGSYANVVEPVPIKKTTLDWQKKNDWRHTTPEMIESYACTDTEQTLLVWEAILRHRGWTVQPSDLWPEKMKIIRVLTEMKRRGVEVDVELARELELEGEHEKEILLDALGGLNPSSVNDIPKIMLDTLKLPVLKTTPAGRPSFTKAVMEEYDAIMENSGRTDPEIGYVRAWRGWTTAMGLLLRPYQERVSPDGRLRTSYTTHVTSTGRLSSKEPNLQQISKGADPKPWNDRVKKCFRAKPGFVLLSADYSQLELRLAVAYAQEPELQAVFNEGRDIFTEMSEEMGWTRPKTKSFVYATQYGAGDERISYIFGVDKAEAKRKREKFYRKYRRFRALDMACRSQVEDHKSLKLWSGRVRHFQKTEENYKAMNALLQGGAADIVERVWVHVMEHLDNEDCRALLQVHDALVFEVREDLVQEYAQKIHDTMVSVNEICAPTLSEPLFPVKFEVEVEVWGGEKIDLYSDKKEAA